jgi:hypothetical protein
MSNRNNNHVKIRFNFYSNVLEEQTIETMCAQTIDSQKGIYEIDNIPFYASLATGDIVIAEYNEDEQMLTYTKTLEYSGNSTVQVVILSKKVPAIELRDIFDSKGCETEQLNDGYFVINVPANKEYKIIKDELVMLEEKGVIDYAEPALSDKHWIYWNLFLTSFFETRSYLF